MDEKLHFLLLALGIIFSVLAMVTVVTNTLLLLAFWRNSAIFRSSISQFLIGISIANLLTGAITDPLEAYRCFVFLFQNGTESFESNMRKAHMISFVSFNASLLMCLGLSVCQFIAVMRPHHYTNWVTRVNVWCCMLGAVVFTVVFALLRVMGLPVKDIIFVETFLMLTIIPLCLVVLNTLLYIRYHKQQQNLKASNSIPERHEGELQAKRRRFNKRFTMAAIVLVTSVTVFTLPESIISYIDVFWKNRTKEQNKKIITYEAFIDAFFLLKFALDPLICVWRFPSIRKVVLKQSCTSCRKVSRVNADIGV